MKRLVLPILLVLSGCATVEPDAIRVYAGHVSHAAQHFGDHPTNYGYNTVNVEAHWQRGGAFVDLAEGIVLDPRDTQVPFESYGAMPGPREIFTARVGYEWKLK